MADGKDTPDRPNPSRELRKGVDQETQNLHAAGKQVSLFKYLTPVEREMIYSSCKKQQYPDGEVILQEGVPGSGLYIIDRGRVSVIRRGKQDEDIVLATIKDGGHFGEMSILNDEPTSARVVAMGDVAVYLIEKKTFFSLLDLNKSLSNKVLRAMCEELSNRLRIADLLVT